ncbi:MAG: hypothetical protein ACRCW1_00620 [Anaerotignaceae bacterium]
MKISLNDFNTINKMEVEPMQDIVVNMYKARLQHIEKLETQVKEIQALIKKQDPEVENYVTVKAWDICTNQIDKLDYHIDNKYGVKVGLLSFYEEDRIKTTVTNHKGKTAEVTIYDNLLHSEEKLRKRVAWAVANVNQEIARLNTGLTVTKKSVKMTGYFYDNRFKSVDRYTAEKRLQQILALNGYNNINVILSKTPAPEGLIYDLIISDSEDINKEDIITGLKVTFQKNGSLVISEK